LHLTVFAPGAFQAKRAVFPLPVCRTSRNDLNVRRVQAGIQPIRAGSAHRAITTAGRMKSQTPPGQPFRLVCLKHIKLDGNRFADSGVY
jgi:hypothetical protein